MPNSDLRLSLRQTSNIYHNLMSNKTFVYHVAHSPMIIATQKKTYVSLLHTTYLSGRTWSLCLFIFLPKSMSSFTFKMSYSDRGMFVNVFSSIYFQKSSPSIVNILQVILHWLDKNKHTHNKSKIHKKSIRSLHFMLFMWVSYWRNFFQTRTKYTQAYRFTMKFLTSLVMCWIKATFSTIEYLSENCHLAVYFGGFGWTMSTGPAN